jgi:hypothetical protein
MRGPELPAEPVGRHARDMSYGPRPGSRPDSGSARIRARLAPCPEIDCVRHLLAPANIAAAELRAAETRTGADRVLVTEGTLTDRVYVRALARHCGLAIETLRHIPRSACPVSDDDLIFGLASGIIPIRTGADLIWVVAPWHLSARFLIGTLQRHPEMRSRLRVTTMDDMRDFAHREAEFAIACRAAFDMRAQRPGLSAGSARSRHPAQVVRRRHGLCRGPVRISIAHDDCRRHRARAGFSRLERASRYRDAALVHPALSADPAPRR